jgi:hypothetical protein
MNSGANEILQGTVVDLVAFEQIDRPLEVTLRACIVSVFFYLRPTGGARRVRFTISHLCLLLLDYVGDELVMITPCGRGGVQERRHVRTRTGGTDPARHRLPEMVLA